MVDLDAELGRWVEWITGPIYDDILGAVLGRQIWTEYNDMVREAPDLVRDAIPTYSSWVNRNYQAALGSAIRRQVDLRSDVIGMGRLLQHMARYPKAMTRQRVLDTIGDDLGTFETVATTDAGMLDPTNPSTDLDELIEVAKPVRRWVSKAIAHYDQNQKKFLEDNRLTYGEIHEVLEHLTGLFQKYFLLLTQSAVVLGQGIITEPWQGAFTVPWWEIENPFATGE